MIFVTVGSQKFPMDRLLRAVDDLLDSGALRGEVIAQSGTSTYTPRNFQAIPFLDRDVMHGYIRTCDMMICHAGASSILTGVKAGRRVVVLPRRADLGEHVDDHQRELAAAFSQGGYVLTADEVENLPACVEKAKAWTPKEYVSGTGRIVALVMQALE